MTWHRWLEDSSECQTNQDSDRTGSETERSGGYWVEKTNEKPALTCSDGTGITFITLNGQIPSTVTWLKYTRESNSVPPEPQPLFCHGSVSFCLPLDFDATYMRPGSSQEVLIRRLSFNRISGDIQSPYRRSALLLHNNNLSERARISAFLEMPEHNMNEEGAKEKPDVLLLIHLRSRH